MSAQDKGYDNESSEIIIYNKLKDLINITIDVGAREDLYLFETHPNCVYHLFEPNKQYFETLRNKVSNISDHTIKLNNCGLSNISQNNAIYYTNVESFAPHPFVPSYDRGERYSLKTLDEYVEKEKIQHIDFLKIDCEGWDYKIILGGKGTINSNKISCIQFEWWDGVQKFVDLLKDKYEMFMITEPALRAAIKRVPKTAPQLLINYNQLLVKLDEDVIGLIDNQCRAIGAGGNILALSRYDGKIWGLECL